MIKLEFVHIEEVRGIRKLDIDFQRATFAISGPNGSGKSGVIDAIEFGLTGQIGRLTGRGTKGLSVAEHGPHVDKTKFPDAAFVELRVFLPSIGKSATITRKVMAPSNPKIVPADDDIKAALAEIADHPEITLSRREILRFILVEPSKRSEEIQTILKLDEIGQTRSALNTAQNRLETAHTAALAHSQANRNALLLHLQIPTLRSDEILEIINTRRRVLGLQDLTALTADTDFRSGLSPGVKVLDFNKSSALRDLKALNDAAEGFPDLANSEAAAIVAGLSRLETDPALLGALQRRAFIEKGLDLLEGADCPLCDSLWEDEEHLRNHLKAKLTKSEDAGKIQKSLLSNGITIGSEVIRVVGLLTRVEAMTLGEGDSIFANLLKSWKLDLETLRAKLESVNGMAGLKDRLAFSWVSVPTAFSRSLSEFTTKIESKPDQTQILDAQTFLTTAQIRLDEYRAAMVRNKAAERAWKSAKTAHEIYCAVLKDELDKLYNDVQEEFSAFYREINEEDEVNFTAKLSPSKGKLDFDVNFYERGLFPPGAYHSEGHQDSMGVCLYLALMKHLYGKQFTFALLDDVVMSVDSSHRYQFCQLLKKHFSNTQFIITTHDRLWAEQMKSAGLVSAKTSIVFQSWTIDTGPLVESNQEIWDEIAGALGKGKVDVAAPALRRHLEYVSRNLADQIGATPQFRANGNYELGDLLPSVLARMNHLLSKAADAAQSWVNDSQRAAVRQRKESLSASAGASNVEQWAVNKAVHYNEWANFGKNDFEPVVVAYKQLLACFQCETCKSWLHTAPRNAPETLRCDCNAVSLNLTSKPKRMTA